MGESSLIKLAEKAIKAAGTTAKIKRVITKVDPETGSAETELVVQDLFCVILPASEAASSGFISGTMINHDESYLIISARNSTFTPSAGDVVITNGSSRTITTASNLDPNDAGSLLYQCMAIS